MLSHFEQVVDVGGGTGFCTQGVVKTVSPTNVTLLDQSPHQLEKARKKADLQGISIVEVPSQPISSLPFASYDNAFLHRTPDTSPYG